MPTRARTSRGARTPVRPGVRGRPVRIEVRGRPVRIPSPNNLTPPPRTPLAAAAKRLRARTTNANPPPVRTAQPLSDCCECSDTLGRNAPGTGCTDRNSQASRTCPGAQAGHSHALPYSSSKRRPPEPTARPRAAGSGRAHGSASRTTQTGGRICRHRSAAPFAPIRQRLGRAGGKRRNRDLRARRSAPGAVGSSISTSAAHQVQAATATGRPALRGRCLRDGMRYSGMLPRHPCAGDNRAGASLDGRLPRHPHLSRRRMPHLRTLHASNGPIEGRTLFLM